MQDGWNFTGDTYVRDADGYFWYQARSDDMIISGGYNIAGPEIEEMLLGHPDVAECGVVGVPDEARGQIVKAFVVLRDGASGGDAKVAELQEFVKQRIAPYKYPPKAVPTRLPAPPAPPHPHRTPTSAPLPSSVGPGKQGLGSGKLGSVGMAHRPLQLLMAWGVLPPARPVREPLMGTCGLIAGS